MENLLSLLQTKSEDFILMLSFLAAFLAIIAGFTGTIKGLRSQKEVSPDDLRDEDKEQTPFERVVLAKYYNQALTAANVSFWFSIAFASVGFVVILLSFATYTPDDPVGTIIKITSGAVIDAVSGLFFIQSQNARKSMADFFEKLRLDRLSAEAREMINEIDDVAARDQLRMQLVMKFSGIEKIIVSDKVVEN